MPSAALFWSAVGRHRFGSVEGWLLRATVLTAFGKNDRNARFLRLRLHFFRTLLAKDPSIQSGVEPPHPTRVPSDHPSSEGERITSGRSHLPSGTCRRRSRLPNRTYPVAAGPRQGRR